MAPPGRPTPLGPIAIVAHTHPSVTRGGGEIAAYALYEGLRQAGTPAIFIAACPVEDRHRIRLASADEYVLPTERLRYDEFFQLAAGAIWRQLKSILVARGVRLVNFHHYINLGMNALRALAAETDIPFVVTFHEFMAICANQGQMVTRPDRALCDNLVPEICTQCYPHRPKQQFRARYELMRDALDAAAAFVAPSHFAANRLAAWGLSAAKFTIIENGLRALPEAAAKSRTHKSGRPWVFGSFGQITPYKGVDTILDALDLLATDQALAARIRMRIHGGLSGQTEAFRVRFEQTIAAHAFADYAGPYENQDIFRLMADCDYVMVTSTWWENSPVVIQEAFAAGRPVICTGIGGMAEKVPAGTGGLHVKRADAASLLQAMAKAADPVTYKLLRAGLPEVGTQASMACTYLSLFESVLKTRPAPTGKNPALPSANQARA